MSGANIRERELNQASTALQTTLADPTNKDGFLMSVIDLSNGAERSATAEPASSMRRPEASAGGGINFDAAFLRGI